MALRWRFFHRFILGINGPYRMSPTTRGRLGRCGTRCPRGWPWREREGLRSDQWGDGLFRHRGLSVAKEGVLSGKPT